MRDSLSPDALLWLAVAAALAAALTAAARAVAPRLSLLDRPDGVRKTHQQPMPLLGGVAVYGSLLACWLAATAIGWTWLSPAAAEGPSAPMILLSAGLFCLLGLWDDICPLRPRSKLMLQIIACMPYVTAGRCIESVHILGYAVDLGWFGLAFTIFWLVGCSNVLNLIDGLDGLAGTVALIMTLSVAVLSLMQGHLVIAALAVLFAGSLFGFLIHNWPPARIYLGDAGSLMIGFVIGALAIEASLKRATGFALAVPLVLVSIPVFDTCMAIIRRRLSGRGIGEADRGHIHHCLQARGLTRGQSLMVISGLCLEMAATTLLAACFNSDLLALAFCLSLLGLLILGRVFGYQETALLMRQLRTIGQTIARRPDFGMTVESIRPGQREPAVSVDDWPQAIDERRAIGERDFAGAGVNTSVLTMPTRGTTANELSPTADEAVGHAPRRVA